MSGVKRTAVLEGGILSIGHEKLGSPVMVAVLDLPDSKRLPSDLNAARFSLGDLHTGIELRGADLRWLGKRCKLTVTIEVEP